MAARKLNYLIFFTIVGCCFSIIILGVSFGTKNWYETQAVPVTQDSSSSQIDINYGLFAGSKTLSIKGGTPWNRILYLSCMTDKNICMYSCGTTKADRKSDIEHWYKSNGTNLDSELCPKNTNAPVKKYKDSQTNAEAASADKKKFLNYGLWLTTVIFLCGGILFSAIAGSLALFNTFRAPSQPILSVFGLYIWNGLAAACTMMTLIIYGSAFASSLKKESAISDTIGSNYEASNAKLGYSYWILVLAEIISLANIGILRYRTWVIYKQETTVRVIDDKITSPDTLLY